MYTAHAHLCSFDQLFCVDCLPALSTNIWLIFCIQCSDKTVCMCGRYKQQRHSTHDRLTYVYFVFYVVFFSVPLLYTHTIISLATAVVFDIFYQWMCCQRNFQSSQSLEKRKSSIYFSSHSISVEYSEHIFFPNKNR